MKSIVDEQERKEALKGAFSVDKRYKYKKILIFDDLFRSGSTLQELAHTMYLHGEVSQVYFLTITRTRIKK